ncbi:MAG: dethiobiotin synthase [Gammaproteobacteria bacterium RIFCSPLOWO2_02_FULL_56_15]|nr:MAG: dethiobiotin synthase [Gammaproteobacteria bacterium RIFCSPLOWO2_02_FULL_56_15]
MKSFFITGTDTGVGKTRFTLELMQYYKNQDMRVAGMKPVATGSVNSSAGYRNEDALAILACCSRPEVYEDINPYALIDPVAPIIAARRENRKISRERIIRSYKKLQEQADLIVVEGVGGWRVQLGEDFMLAELVAQLQMPIVLVVGLRLGCINHALLSVEGICNDGLELCGWVANSIDPDFSGWEDYLHLLQEAISVPMLAYMPYTEAGTDTAILWQDIDRLY